MSGTASASNAGVRIEEIAFDAPWAWLASGWRDLWAAPRVSLTYGAVFATLSIGLTLGLMMSGLVSLVLALAVLIGPIAAVGLYEASRCLEAGEDVSFRPWMHQSPASPSYQRRLPCISAERHHQGDGRQHQHDTGRT